MINALSKHRPESPAIVDSSTSQVMSYAELCSSIAALSSHLKELPGRPLIFLCADNSPEAIVAYLACLSADFPICLLEAGSPPSSELLESYDCPHVLSPAGTPAPAGYLSSTPLRSSTFQLACARDSRDYAAKTHPELSLLLQTSGSTGNPKLVRLSAKSVEANARAIVAYLGIAPGQRSMQSLPMSYSYGLSLINSHLLAGATVVLSAHSFLRPEFWRDFDRQECSSFAGVPFMYETLEKLRFDPAAHPSLKVMTQAGGGLRADVVQSLFKKTNACGARFFVMYGQTEATARISFVPPERLQAKLGSIGVPIPGGRWELSDVPGMRGAKELVYCGPNVMMGYAENAQSLAQGDEMKGRLATGDLARLDEEGYAYLEGRLKRIAKVFGLRIQLEDVERRLETQFSVRAAAIDAGDVIRIYFESDGLLEIPKIKAHLAAWLELPPTAFVLEQIESLPRNSSGKKDYGRLAAR